MRWVLIGVFWSCLGFVSPLFAQQEQATNRAAVVSREVSVPGTSPAMDRMAESMTGMAEMCRTMMEKEMAGRPLKVAALVTAGVLALALTIATLVLEIQWIRLLSLRIQVERQALKSK